MVIVLGVNRRTGEEKKIAEFETEQEAERFCEEWGWFYDDGDRYSMCIYGD